MNRYREIEEALRDDPRVWLVTGAAGFIGSNLTEHLLELGQMVVGLDNFSTGSHENVDDVCAGLGREQLRNLYFVEGDIRDLGTCRTACHDVDFVLHQAALGSVPRSMDDPIETNTSNVDGFLNMLVAARDAGVQRFVYAASSATYGDHEGLPKVEGEIGRPLSPYAVTKLVNELYAEVFQRAYGLHCVGLRYFNVFGPRQDPEGAYAAVVPKWIGSLLAGTSCHINGDGETSRDFCYVANAIQANLLAAVAGPETDEARVYNVACGRRTTLNELFGMIRGGLTRYEPRLASAEPEHRDFRPGDVMHSQADISRIEKELGYRHTHEVEEGMRSTLAWFVERERAGTPDAGVGS
ncbi:MAG: SDR family oxidoreductase [Candidatus Palauibacterales bacterium]|nr:SDR family oxidoreductase [Candidatus Palauibacterales bacterium]